MTDQCRSRRPAPVRLAHLGLGNFFRSHQAWYTEHAGDRDSWGYAAFAGTGPGLAATLRAQDGVYTLIERGPDRDRFERVGSISAAYPAGDVSSWLDLFASPALSVVTVTVTEAGWLTGSGSGPQPDLAVLRRLRRSRGENPGGAVATAPGRLLAGLVARWHAGAGPLAVVSCDNMAGNGAIAAQVLCDLADLVDPVLGEWVGANLATPGTVVDRITPRTTERDLAEVARDTGFEDRCPVVAEPFSEWILSGPFPAGRPRWEDAGATFTSDITPFERRKLWLLNGAHSLLAYAGSIRGHVTVPDALSDDVCRAWVEQWWDEASLHLEQAPEEIAAYREQLLRRFSNRRMADPLDRIAADGSQKLPVRVVPVLEAERAAGRLPAGAIRIVAAWICHLRGSGPPIADARADDVVPLARRPVREACASILDRLRSGLGDDDALVDAVAEEIPWLLQGRDRRAGRHPQ